MNPISLEFIPEGNLFAEDWPGHADDYGHIIYTYTDNKTHRDSGGYLLSFIWNLLEGLGKIKKAQEYCVNSLDGDFGLRISPSENEVKVTIYSGAYNIFSTEMSKNDFINFSLETAKGFFETVLKINPDLERNGNFLAPYTLMNNLEKNQTSN